MSEKADSKNRVLTLAIYEYVAMKRDDLRSLRNAEVLVDKIRINYFVDI